jgi:hypothetical protein
MCILHISRFALRCKKNVQHAHMHRFVDAILAPLARLCVAHGLPFADIAERLKQHYVAAARAQAGPRATDSRLSVMTGLQRREVIRLATLPDADVTPKPNPLSRLVYVWRTDHAGRALPRIGPEGSFEALARSIRRDVHPRTMLEQLLAAGTIRVGDDGLVHLLADSYQPVAGSEAQIAYLADNAGDFLNAATENTLAPAAPFFERAAHFNQLSAHAVLTLDKTFRAGQMALLTELGREAARLQDTAPGPYRFRAGGFFYHTVTPKEDR